MVERLQIGAYFHVGNDLLLKKLYKLVIRRLLVESQGQNLFEYFLEGIWAHLDEFLGVLDVESLIEVVSKDVVPIFEHFNEVRPGQLVLVKQVDHDVHERLDVVSAGLNSAAASVKTGELEVSGEALFCLLLDMFSIIIDKPLRDTKVDQVNGGGVLVAHQDIVQLQVVVDVTE